jgi:hypothetical protein
MKRIILAIAAVALAGGVASADRWHGGRGGEGRVEHSSREGGVRVTPSYRGNYNGGYHGTYNAGYRGNWNGGYRYERPVYNGGYRYSYARRPIYVERPVIRTHYYDYRYRPQILVENYPVRDGYYWVAGQWTWNGSEWLWTPGHYEPDPNYGISAGVYYDSGY